MTQQVALMTQQTILDLQPPSAVRDEEDWESVTDSSASGLSSGSEIADDDVFDAIVAAWLPRLRAAWEMSEWESSTSDRSSASDIAAAAADDDDDDDDEEEDDDDDGDDGDDGDDDVFEAIVAAWVRRLRAAKVRKRNMSGSSTSSVSPAAEANEDEIVAATVAAFLPKLRAGRAIVRQEALVVNRELGIDVTTVSITPAQAALATTNMQMGTAVTMEEVEAMWPIDLKSVEPEEELGREDLEEDESEEIVLAFIRKVKDENEKALAASS